MNKFFEKEFVIGLAVGIVLTFLVTSLGGGLFKPQSHLEVLAEIDGRKLTRSQLDKTIAGQLIPIENDQYQILKQGVDTWLESELLAKEAASHRVPVKVLIAKELWNQVRVSQGDALMHFRKNPELYGNQNFDSLQTALTKKLRDVEYERLKQQYLEKLKTKYHAQVHLKEPGSYVQGLALPPSDFPGAFPEAKLPANVPPAAVGAPAVKTATFDDLAGRPSMGPENAPVTIVEFSDFHCPFCKRVEPTIDQLMKNYAGKIRKVWRHYPLPFHTGADRTHMASECAHDQGKFWEYHAKIFENQGSTKDDASLIRLAEELKLDKGKFQSCLASDKNKEAVEKDVTKAKASGVSGTPAFFVNGRLLSGAKPYDEFKNAVEASLDPSKAAALWPAVPVQPQGPAAAPTNVVFNDLEGRPTEGKKDAPISLVIFSDFHCPFCKRVEPTIDQLMKNYAGKIKKVWRHYPLPFHQGADRTHMASECASEQGKFWQYHKKLIEAPSSPKDDAELIQLAKDADLNKRKFESCLSSNKYQDLIKKEIAAGARYGVRGTPAVFVNGQLVSGAQPYENFDKIIREKLAKK